MLQNWWPMDGYFFSMMQLDGNIVLPTWVINYFLYFLCMAQQRQQQQWKQFEASIEIQQKVHFKHKNKKNLPKRSYFTVN